MKLLGFCVILIGTTLATKEVEEEFASLFSDDLIHELEKRLRDYENEESNTDKKCDFHQQDSTIIKTRESLENGAVFIDSPVTSSKQECSDLCCNTDQCDVAVFKEQKKNACYLFTCGEPSLCTFSKHDGFLSMNLMGGVKYNNMHNSATKDHPQELEDLVSKSSTTVAAPTTSTTLATTTVTEKEEPVPLFGVCTKNQRCGVKGSECLAGYCVCKTNFHPQDGICRASCTRFQFECKNEGQPLASPQCIAVYDNCDGIVHCKDGSDEDNCPSSVQGYKNTAKNPQTASELSDVNNSQDDGTNAVDKANTRPINDQLGMDSIAQPNGEAADGNRKAVTPNGEPDTKKIPNNNEPLLPQKVEVPSSSTTNKMPSTQPTTLLNTMKPAVTETAKNKMDKIQPSQVEKKIGSSVNKSNSAVQPSAPEISVSKVQVVGDTPKGLNDAVINEVISSSKRSNYTAVVVLGMGLAITALLLIFVGCRLRNVKRRLRRGRPMNSNEADYLINGMYL